MFPVRIPACQSALFPLSFPFADREGLFGYRWLSRLPIGRVWLGFHPRFPLPREPDPLPTDPAAAEPSPAPPPTGRTPWISRKRLSASEVFFCQGQNNSHLPLAAQ